MQHSSKGREENDAEGAKKEEQRAKRLRGG